MFFLQIYPNIYDCLKVVIKKNAAKIFKIYKNNTVIFSLHMFYSLTGVKNY